MNKMTFLKKLTLAALFANFLCPPLTHAQEDQATEDTSVTNEEGLDLIESEASLEDLMDDIIQANQSVQSVVQEIELDSKVSQEGEEDLFNQKAVMEAIYGEEGQVDGAYIYSLYDQNGEQMIREQLMPTNEKTIYTRFNEEEWEKDSTEYTDQDQYFLTPNYHHLLADLLELESYYTLYEDANSYILITKDPNADLFHVLQPHFDLQLTGMEPEAFHQGVFLSINKDTLLFEDLMFVMTYDDGSSSLEMSAVAIMSQWNELTATDYQMDQTEADQEETGQEEVDQEESSLEETDQEEADQEASQEETSQE